MTRSNQRQSKGLRKVLKKVSSWVGKKAGEQWTPMDGVVPAFRWSDGTQSFYLNSVAGLIKFKPKTLKENTEFRNTIVNRFEALAPDDREGFFELYAEIRENYKVSFTANVRTRLRGRSCVLRKLL